MKKRFHYLIVPLWAAMALLILGWTTGLALAQPTEDTNKTVATKAAAASDHGKTPASESPCDIERLKLGVWSLFFTTFGLVCGILILARLWSKDHPQSRFTDFFANGQFVQLVVIIMIAGNVCSLGVMGILKTGEIATIYASIVGYILGKRTSPDKSDNGGTGEKNYKPGESEKNAMNPPAEKTKPGEAAGTQTKKT